MSLPARWSQILDELRRQERLRTLTLPSGLDFTSNDYLGYGRGVRGPQHRLCAPSATAPAAMAHSGTASRLLRGHHPLWEEVESRLAQWHGAEAALVMTSGYAANEGLLSTVIAPEDWVASDALNHASIIDGLRLCRAERCIYPHNDLNAIEAALKNAAEARPVGRELFVVTESHFSMEGDRAPLAQLVPLARRYGAHLIVDEAHATGCFGPTGSGLVDALDLRDGVLATVHTGGKALGVCGAYVCGSQQLKELLINRCRHLIFTTALPPTVAGWWLEMLPVIQADEAGRTILHQNAARFRAVLSSQGITALGQDYLIPVQIGSDRQAVEAASFLQQQGFDIRAIRPPTVPAGTSRLRIAIHVDQDCDTLENAAQAVATAVHQTRRLA
jgi:8-amino-7-oxononanoate synthase